MTGLFALVWSYWPSFLEMADQWERNPEYSHGYLVPLLAGVLLWYRHGKLNMGRPRAGRAAMVGTALSLVALFAVPTTVVETWGWLFAGGALLGALWMLCPREFEAGKFRPTWWGLPLLATGMGLQLFGAYYYIESLVHLSLVPSLAGVVLLTVGWRALRWSWPAVLFVVFMMPLPHTLEGMLRGPLRFVGTKVSTFLMQTMGLPAFAEGHRHEILVGGMTHRIGVDEACSGLAMLMIFFALSTAVVLLINRPWWERITILLSAVPIALVANIVRITTTGIMLYTLEDQSVYLGAGSFALIDMSGTEFAQSFFHDWAGWMMMPLALGIMWMELAVLKRVVVVEEETPLATGLMGGAPSTANPPSETTKNNRAENDHVKDDHVKDQEGSPEKDPPHDVYVTSATGGRE